MMMLSGINVFKSTLFFLVWAEVLLHLEHDMKFTSGKSSLQTHFGRPGNKNLPSLCYSILCSSFTRSNTQIYRVIFFLTRGGYLHFKTTYKYKSMPCYN